MRTVLSLAAVLVLVSCGPVSARVVSANGVRLRVPSDWRIVDAVQPKHVPEPVTLLVIGTPGIAPRSSVCQIAAYRVRPRGAVVVVVGWKHLALSGPQAERPGRRPLARLTTVRRPSFECFSGRGAAAVVKLDGKVYQVNVVVGDRAPRELVSAALAGARSFDLAKSYFRRQANSQQGHAAAA